MLTKGIKVRKILFDDDPGGESYDISLFYILQN